MTGRGVCGGWEHAWWGTCVVAWGACMVAGWQGGLGMHGGGGHAWWWGHVWWWGGMCGGTGNMHGGIGACMHGGGRGVHEIRRDMVNEWTVRILLECILVYKKVFAESF